MKKNYFLFLILIIGSFNLSAATYTSAANGNWTNIATWSPLGVPLPGDTVTINHNVTLNTNFAYTSGSITINNSGSLIEDTPTRAMWLNGANTTFTNAGTTTINTMLVSLGTFSNFGTANIKVLANLDVLTNNGSGTIQAIDSLYNDGVLTNDGTIKVVAFFNDSVMTNNYVIEGLTTVVDSMYNDGTFTNAAGAILKADSCTNGDVFTNDGIINFDQFTNLSNFTNNNYMSFVDMTNIGTYTNKDSLIGTGSVTNTGTLDNQAGSIFNLSISFLNADPLNFDAHFIANGRFVIGDSFYNYDTISGTAPGSIQVQDTSYNNTTGSMTGTFDFCDLTPPVTPIKIDFNLGTVDPNITYCQWTGVEPVTTNSMVSIYPNPTKGVLFINSEDHYTVDVYNVLGKLLMTTSDQRINLSRYQSGVYFVLLKDEWGNLIKQEKIIKE